MTHETNVTSLDRRRFLSLGAAAGAGVVTTALAGPALADDGPAKGSAPMMIQAKPLPEKVFTTEAAGISKKTHTAHYTLYQGYVKKVNDLRASLSGGTLFA